MEHVELDFFPRCDDGSLPPSAQLYQWARFLAEATERAYKPLTYNIHTRQMLESQGFVDIREQVIRVPFNPWPSDPQEKAVGRWYNLGITQGLEATSLAPLTRMLGWKKEQVDGLIAEAKREICQKKYHVYCEM